MKGSCIDVTSDSGLKLSTNFPSGITHPAQEWRNRTVAEHACSKMGRAAARHNVPKQPRVIRAGPNEGGKKLGPQYRGLSAKTHNTGVYLGISLINPWYRFKKSDQPPVLGTHFFFGWINKRNVDLP